MLATPDRAATITIMEHGRGASAASTATGRLLAMESSPAGLCTTWAVTGFDGHRARYTTATEAREALWQAAADALDKLPPCGLTHDEHMAVWRSWRDDCVDPVTGCGFAVRDVDQCDRGHPDDGVTWCGACGHEKPTPPAV